MKFLQIEVNKQNYLLDTDIVTELIHFTVPMRTSYHHKKVEGVINHKDKIIPIVYIRNLLDFISFKDEQISFIAKVEEQHKVWVKEFENSLKTGEAFTKAVDPHKCELGKWIDKTEACLHCNTHGFVDLLSEKIIEHHDALHQKGAQFLQDKSLNRDEKIETIKSLADKTIEGLDNILENIDKLTSAFEQVVLINVDGKDIGIVVDRIEKTYDLETKEFFTSKKNLSSDSKYIQFINHYDIDGSLMFSMNFTQEFKELFSESKL